MDPIFKKCLLALTKINEELIPTMNQAYSQMMQIEQTSIQNNQNLNQSRQFAQSAIEAQNSGLIDNAIVKRNIQFLADIDGKLNSESRYLTDLLESIKNRFISKSKNIAHTNMDYLNKMKTSNINAQELLNMIVKLAKEIQSVINDEIPGYKQELNNYIKKSERNIVDDAFRYYNEIQKQDSGTLPAIKNREWTHLPNELFRTPGAFVNTSYDVV
jgi:hypothetical protein